MEREALGMIFVATRETRKQDMVASSSRNYLIPSATQQYTGTQLQHS
uniref:Uncharacterized protein n=1 Tax=Setaria viridis TaxID=4556 RepID=A0A4U6TMN5_SETVI|nr:hypothetical protein SEVIR_7G070100v2 [Setaria viridis]